MYYGRLNKAEDTLDDIMKEEDLYYSSLDEARDEDSYPYYDPDENYHDIGMDRWDFF